MSTFIIDTEFNLDLPPNDNLLSIALFNPDKKVALYLHVEPDGKYRPIVGGKNTEWLLANVYDKLIVTEEILSALPDDVTIFTKVIRDRSEYADNIESFIKNFNTDPLEFLADYPIDFIHLVAICEKEPGTFIKIPEFTMRYRNIDAYPSANEKLLQHNSLHDAYALAEKL